MVDREAGQGLELTVDAEEPVSRLLRDLRSSSTGLSGREAARRLIQHGPNELHRRGGRRVWSELGRQFTHPLALLLWAAAALAWLARFQPIAIAIVIVIFLNAIFAFIQEMQAERAVEALQAYLAQHATVLRDDVPTVIDATQIVPGDVMVVAEGDRISADGRLLDGTIEVDTSTLTGESMPVARSARWTDTGVPVGVLSNPYLIGAIGIELALTAAVIYLPPLQSVLSTAALPPSLLVITLPFPFIVWGAGRELAGLAAGPWSLSACEGAR